MSLVQKGSPRMMRRSIAVTVILAAASFAGAGLLAQGPAPTAPGNLTYQVSGGNVFLNWVFVYGKLGIAYIEQDARTGETTETSFGWDQVQNKAWNQE